MHPLVRRRLFVRPPLGSRRGTLMMKRSSGLLEGAAEIRNVVEGLARESFGYVACLLAVMAYHNDPGIVVLHREPSIVLGPAHLTRILAWEHEIPGDVPGLRERARHEACHSACVDDHGRPVLGQHM